MENGGWPRRAPLGYINKRDKRTAWVEVDPKIGPLIAKAFEEIASDRWTLKEWAEHAYDIGYRGRKGNKLAVSSWSHIFNNRFYIGEVYLRKGDVPTKGTHTPLVEPDTFALVQEVLRKHDNYKQRSQRHKYLLQGLLHSVDSESLCWVESHPKKRSRYYRSKAKVDGKQLFYNTKVIDAQITDIMKDITITNEAAIMLKHELTKWFDNEDNSDQELKKAEARLVKLHKMEKNLQGAKMSIDMLEMIKEKTEGNLTGEEQKVLDNTVADLQLNYVDEVKIEASKPKEAAVEKKQTEDKGKTEEKAEEKK